MQRKFRYRMPGFACRLKGHSPPVKVASDAIRFAFIVNLIALSTEFNQVDFAGIRCDD